MKLLHYIRSLFTKKPKPINTADYDLTFKFVQGDFCELKNLRTKSSQLGEKNSLNLQIAKEPPIRLPLSIMNFEFTNSDRIQAGFPILTFHEYNERGGGD